MAGDASEPFGEGLGVAVGAAGGDLGATPNGVPSCVGPLDFGSIAHRESPKGSEYRGGLLFIIPSLEPETRYGPRSSGISLLASPPLSSPLPVLDLPPQIPRCL